MDPREAPVTSSTPVVADEGGPIREITGVIGRHDVPAVAMAPEDVADHFTRLADFVRRREVATAPGVSKS